MKHKGEYYIDFDEELELWLVCHTEISRTFSSWCTQDAAQRDANYRNNSSSCVY